MRRETLVTETATTPEQVDLLINALAHISLDYDRWGQRDWAKVLVGKSDAAEPTMCQTAFCMAGWLAVLGADAKPIYQWIRGPANSEEGAGYWHASVLCKTAEGHEIPYSHVAHELLGTDYDNDTDRYMLVDSMFYEKNTLDDLYGYVSELTGLNRADLHLRVARRTVALADERTKHDDNA